MTGTLIKERNVDENTDMQRESNASTSQGAPRTTSEPLEAGERPGNRLLLTVPGRNQAHHTLIWVP